MVENTVKNIMIVGVGGQGTLLTSRLLGEIFIRAGFDVKVSEVHGMSQRGGSVVTYVRYGKEVASPIIDIGEADIILAFEALEAARYLPYLKRGGIMIASNQEIAPITVITGAAAYPENLLGKLAGHDIKFISCDALSLALQAGSAKAVNVTLLGVLAGQMDFPDSEWENAINTIVPEKFRDMNIKAFALGKAAGH